MPELIEANAHTVDASQLRESLVFWGRNNFRPFPWRLTREPYKILLSEVMLHRTQASQVLPVYEQFTETYPNPQELIKATKSELHEVLYSLGLRWRIDMIFEMGTKLVEHFDGQIPVNREELLSLPGVSDYIANAVRVFAWNLPEPLGDTNTIRVTGRLFGLSIKDSSRRNRQFKYLLSALLDQENPRLYNYALLDLADKICMKKQKPLCDQCPLVTWCIYGQQRSPNLA